ncbi:septation protein SpoVG family protein [bacterium]|nr:septation protein SpoVG family protein [bacterium]
MKKPTISEIQIVPIKPKDGLVAFASFVLDNNLYLGSIGIMTRPNGGYRLTYPTKKVGSKNINIFHPINKKFAQRIEQAVVKRVEEVMKKSNDRYSSSNS